MDMLRDTLRAIENLAQNELYSEAWSRLEDLTVQDFPDNQDKAIIWRTRAYIHSREGDNQAAISDLDRSIHYFSKEPHPYYARGIIYLQIGKFLNAVHDFSKVLELCDYYKSDYYRESAFFLRADAYVRLKEYKKAIEDCAHVSDNFQTWTDKLRAKNDILAECIKGPVPNNDNDTREHK